jgi:hypothetical protein
MDIALPLILSLNGITVPLLFTSTIQPVPRVTFSLNVTIIVCPGAVVNEYLLFAGFVLITLGFVVSLATAFDEVVNAFVVLTTDFEAVVTGFVVGETKFVLDLLVFALIEFIGFVTVGDKSLLTLEFILLVPFTVAADEALTFKIRAKANSKITENIAFRLI